MAIFHCYVSSPEGKLLYPIYGKYNYLRIIHYCYVMLCYTNLANEVVAILLHYCYHYTIVIMTLLLH